MRGPQPTCHVTPQSSRHVTTIQQVEYIFSTSKCELCSQLTIKTLLERRQLHCTKYYGCTRIPLITQGNSMRAVLEIFQFCFQVLQKKRLLFMKMQVLQTIRPESSFWTALNQKNCRHEVNCQFFLSKFLVNIVAGSGVKTIFVYKVLNRNQEIPPSEFFPNLWRLGRVRDTKFGMNVSTKKLLNYANYQGYSLYHF